MMSRPVKIKFPVRGKWTVMRRPDCHPFALDLRKTAGKGAKFNRSNFLRYLTTGVHVQDYYSWDEPLYSPATGKVVLASDGYEDKHRVSLYTMLRDWFKAVYLYKPNITSDKIDMKPCVGNFLAIELETREVVFMGHLKKGSIKASVGDKLNIGDEIARVGNSGNSTAPQLLIQMLDQAENLLKSRNIRFCFESYNCFHKRKWRDTRDSFPQMKQVLEYNQM